ncbi:tetratricopeptide repeat protein [Oscillochloris sp. ZM17-4]|uniref:SirB1 family protein n=1 Tax=Oscillochloris sp. ZM17-4 TaxID=2866714 RepID=UPI001C731002|nr:tetratricopeptide repeat protein [Oscillochloris sp. ZM17-4]MBX0326093.1 tetratricopeptide repeat protein [Oscillochloris sp. ZM17-4]
MPHQARRLFHSMISQPDQRVPLAEAALMISWEDRGDVDPRFLLAVLDGFADDLRGSVGQIGEPRGHISALNRYLFGQQGFHGNPSSYERPDPSNSHLDQVLLRRSGLPIMLALVYMEVGWRLGLPLSGVALPGHFIVRYRAQPHDLFIDPFSSGSLWSQADCERQIGMFYREVPPDLVRWLMAPPSRGAILSRILRNLKQTYLAQDDVARALSSVERLLLLDSGDPGELRDRGLLRFRAGQIYAAMEDLERYARQNPAAGDIAQIRTFAKELLARVVPLN